MITQNSTKISKSKVWIKWDMLSLNLFKLDKKLLEILNLLIEIIEELKFVNNI